MASRYPVLTRLGVALVDTLVTVFSFIAAVYVRAAALKLHEFGTPIVWSDYWVIAIIIILVWRGLLGYQEAYLGQRFTSLRSEILVVTKTVIFGSLIVLTVAFMIQSKVPRSLIVMFAVVNWSLLCIEKALLYQFIQNIRRRGKNIKKALLLGTEEIAKAFINSVSSYPDWGIQILGLIGNEGYNIGQEMFGYKVVGHTADIRELLHLNPIDELVVAVSVEDLGKMSDVMAICDEEGVPVRIISSFFKDLISKAKADTIHGLPIIKFSSVERNDFEASAKKAMDVSVSAILLVLLLPVFAIIALLIKWDSPGPVFYRWKILGLNKRPLVSYKFRTMVERADDLKGDLLAKNEMNGPAFKMNNDPRITRVGKWLRKLSLDELPQLWSVLKGDLSLVGPRPPLETEVEKYEGWQRRKLSVKPGMTGLWQVSGRNEINDFDDWMRLDMKYIDEWSLWLDVKILFRTVWVVVRGTGK